MHWAPVIINQRGIRVENNGKESSQKNLCNLQAVELYIENY